MNKLLIGTWLCLACYCQAFGQQLPLLSQFQESIGVLNPAGISSQWFIYEHNVQVQGTYHDQWTQIEGNPATAQLSAQMVLDDYEPIVPIAGVYIIDDRTGPTGFTGAYAKIGGIISDDPYTRGISVGMQLGINQYRLRISDLVLRDEETIYAAEDAARLHPDVGVGVFAYQRFQKKMVYAGLSAPQTLGLNLSFRGADGEIETQRYRHYYANAGSIFFLRDHAWIETSMWLKMVPNVPLNTSFNFRYQTSTALFIGFGGSTASAIQAEIGVALGDSQGYDPQTRIGYGFSYNMSSFGPYVGGTHEIHLSYSLNR